ncbi:MAG: Xaa-Pro peptidase family protein [Treponema sp.]|jgi:Xaa-Pro dipeptidase|nr:Xaa-Pro peptidase family protein [Treponema sp.]
MNAYKSRCEKIYDWMSEEDIALVMFEDVEGRRDPAVRWLTGQPGDAVLFLSAADRKNLLVPWDVNMAKLYADADAIAPYNGFGRIAMQALGNAVNHFHIKTRSRIEIPAATPYPLFLNYQKTLDSYELVCRSNGITEEIERQRAVKDAEELGLYKTLASITNDIIERLEKNVKDRTLKTESDVALFIEAEARKEGCEGASFETLAAGPSRSFGIHAFPAYTSAPFAGKGLSILDFGLKYQGYASDVTMTFVQNATPEQEKSLSLVKQAYDLALSMVKPGVSARDIAIAVDAFYGENGKVLPHGLGHGVGLEIHEAPFLRSKSENPWILQSGMIFTIEPGLYDPALGGCRFENDVLVVDIAESGGGGAEELTKTRIVYM